MKSVILYVFLLYSVNGFSVNWKKFGENESGNSFYVDTNSIKKQSGFVYYLNLINYLKPTTNGAYSDVSRYKIDCLKEKQIWLGNIFYSRPMGKGKKITEAIPVWNHYGSTLNEIRYLTPGSIEQQLMKKVCSYFD